MTGFGVSARKEPVAYLRTGVQCSAKGLRIEHVPIQDGNSDQRALRAREWPCVGQHSAGEREGHHDIHGPEAVSHQPSAVPPHPRPRVRDGHKVERELRRYAVGDGADVDVRQDGVDAEEYEECGEAVDGVGW